MYLETNSQPDNTLFIAAIEGALFPAGPTVPPQQTFARIRFDNNGDNIVAGNYTMTHPYGTDIVEVTPDNVAKNQGLRFTEDIGGVPGVFDGALGGRVGPYVRSTGGLITAPDGNIYIGNSVSPTTVTGTLVTSFSVAGPVTGTSNLFILQGKVLGMSVTPSSITFPVQRPGVDSAPARVTVTNLSQAAPLALGPVVIQGANVADFRLVADNCSNATVPASTATVPGTCTFDVVMNDALPAVSGARTITILIAGTLATVPKSTVQPVTGLIDADPPTSTAHFPNVARMPGNVAVTATFNEPMLLSSFTNTTFTVTANGVDVAGAWELDPAKTTAAFIPGVPFTANEVITAATSTVTDLAGNALASALTFSFTADPADFTAPSISLITPANNTTGVRTDAPITITFNEAMLSSTISATSIKVTRNSFVSVETGSTVLAQDVAGTITLNGATATFTPTAALSFGRDFTITVGTSAQDLLRNALAAGQTANFVTNFQPAVPEIVSPANAETGVGRPVVLRWKRSSDSDPGDVIGYHLFLCNNPSFIGGAPNCIQNVPVTPVAAQATGVYYAGIGGGSMLFTLGLGWAFGFKGRKKILTLLAVLLVSGLFIASCSKKGGGGASAPVSTDVTFSVNNLSPNVTYFWKLEADDGKGGVATTRVMTFTTAP
jgi:hypothetical protein